MGLHRDGEKQNGRSSFNRDLVGITSSRNLDAEASKEALNNTRLQCISQSNEITHADNNTENFGLNPQIEQGKHHEVQDLTLI